MVFKFPGLFDYGAFMDWMSWEQLFEDGRNGKLD